MRRQSLRPLGLGLAGDPVTDSGTMLQSPSWAEITGEGQRHSAEGAGGLGVGLSVSFGLEKRGEGRKAERRPPSGEPRGGTLSEQAPHRVAGAQADDEAMTVEPRKFCEETEFSRAGRAEKGSQAPGGPRGAADGDLGSSSRRRTRGPGSSRPCAWPFSAKSGDAGSEAPPTPVPYPSIAMATGHGPPDCSLGSLVSSFPP